ncbi:hypothetical protein ACFWZW_11100 [Microbacterium enclense]|uniref:hypothetical protein n=1 Tax=Microbacterium enclense TaxID=993073 RepID=UPI0036D89CDA
MSNGEPSGFEPLPAERVDGFVRLSAPHILRVAGRTIPADLLGGLLPFERTDRGRQWRSVLLPLRRQLLPLRADAANARRAARRAAAIGSVDPTASDVDLVGAYYPGIHRHLLAVRRTLTGAPEVGLAVIESVRLSVVISTLGATDRRPDGRHCRLVRIDEHLRTPARSRPAPTASRLDLLVSAYLDARRPSR